jgi:hypothetical protein
MHVNCKADPAVADQSQSEFFLTHADNLSPELGQCPPIAGE